MTGTGGLAAAHARLVADPTIQFSFTPLPKPPDIVLPEWLKILGKWIGAAAKFLSPYAIDLFWVGVALAIAAVAFLIARDLLGVRFPTPRRRARLRAAPADWAPEAFKARALLADADRLAAAGRYDEAAHLLLLRGVEDIEVRRPRLVKPALTARDIAALGEVPATARGAFAAIAAVVEKSLFGGERLDGAAYARCRAAYEAFAFPRAWA
ncbi:MAG TPA: DUF4129 domain-containing protein [Caulobacteraceae bacterium]|jgi:hypothetical protein